MATSHREDAYVARVKLLSCDMASAPLTVIGEAIKHLGGLKEVIAVEQDRGAQF